MRPFVLILLIANVVQAQSLADAARKERERQERVQSVMVITAETAKKLLPPQETAQAATPQTTTDTRPVETPPAETLPAQTATAEPAASSSPAATAPSIPVPPAVDLVKKYNEDVAMLRARIQQLLDQEVQLQLQVNSLTNQFFAPVTNEDARRQAQTRIGQTQNELTAVRSELEQTRKTLLQMEAQGPPKQ